MTSAEGSGPSPDLPRNARILLPLFIAALAVLSIYRYSTVPQREVVVLQGRSMGTTWSVKIAVADLPRSAQEKIAKAVETRLNEVDQRMSTWKPDSELSRFNRAPEGHPFRVSTITLQVFELAQQVSEHSHGAFDVTVGPAVDAWGFGPQARDAPAPSLEASLALRRHMGFQHLRVDATHSSLEKLIPGMSCDLSAIAKGFAVDQVAEELSRRGQNDFLVELGGELRASGRHLDGSAWRVGVERPDPGRRLVHQIIELEDLAMATSGDYRNFREIDGRRVSHTIDPRTARPIEHPLASVTVVDRTAAEADAWATALNVLGAKAGYALAIERDMRALFIVHDAQGFRSFTTPRFEPLLASEVAEPE
ncbi:FAD:protein FMN transferase [Myxococcota bacterium]|nr:FAD:protein FMN transferase [Myxococcota bacterium]